MHVARPVPAARARPQARGSSLLASTGGAGQLVAYRSDFRLRWMATKLHTLVVVSTAPEVTAEGLAQFATSSLEWAKVAKGQVRGFAAFVWPVVVDLGSGKRTSHVGHPAIGAV